MAAKVGEYLLLETLGHGAFGKVKLGVHQETGERVAVKIMDKGEIHKNDLTQNVRREITIMKALKHKNIVRLHQVLTTSSKIYVVMELITGGELFDVISKHRHGLKEKAARRYFQQLVDGVVYCHKRKVYHRDLKPENILLSENKEVKVTDFGLSSITRSKEGEKDERFLTTQCGTPCYVAPEVIYAASEGYSGEKADGWACGVVLYALLTGSLPFDSDEMGELFMMIINSEPHYPEHLSKGAKDLLMKMLHKDPKKRINLRQVREHPWFLRNYDNDGGEEIRPRRKRKPVEDANKAKERSSGGSASSPRGAPAVATSSKRQEKKEHTITPDFIPTEMPPTSPKDLVANTVAMFEDKSLAAKRALLEQNTLSYEMEDPNAPVQASPGSLIERTVAIDQLSPVLVKSQFGDKEHNNESFEPAFDDTSVSMTTADKDQFSLTDENSLDQPRSASAEARIFGRLRSKFKSIETPAQKETSDNAHMFASVSNFDGVSSEHVVESETSTGKEQMGTDGGDVTSNVTEALFENNGLGDRGDGDQMGIKTYKEEQSLERTPSVTEEIVYSEQEIIITENDSEHNYEEEVTAGNKASQQVLGLVAEEKGTDKEPTADQTEDIGVADEGDMLDVLPHVQDPEQDRAEFPPKSFANTDEIHVDNTRVERAESESNLNVDEAATQLVNSEKMGSMDVLASEEVGNVENLVAGKKNGFDEVVDIASEENTDGNSACAVEPTESVVYVLVDAKEETDIKQDVIPEDEVDIVLDEEVDIVLDEEVEPTAEEQVGTIPDEKVNTIPDERVKTIPDEQVDTVVYGEVDTVVYGEVDTVVYGEVDTVVYGDIDTVLNEEVDTVLDEEVDTVLNEEVDTVLEEEFEILREERLNTTTPQEALLEGRVDSEGPRAGEVATKQSGAPKAEESMEGNSISDIEAATEQPMGPDAAETVESDWTQTNDTRPRECQDLEDEFQRDAFTVSEAGSELDVHTGQRPTDSLQKITLSTSSNALMDDDDEDDDEANEVLENFSNEEVGEFYAIRRLQTVLAMAKTADPHASQQDQFLRAISFSQNASNENHTDEGDYDERKETLQALETVKRKFMSIRRVDSVLTPHEQTRFQTLLTWWECKLKDGSVGDDIVVDDELLTPFQKLLRWWDSELTGKYAAEEVEDVGRASSVGAGTGSEIWDDEYMQRPERLDSEITEEIEEYEVEETDDEDEGRTFGSEGVRSVEIATAQHHRNAMGSDLREDADNQVYDEREEEGRTAAAEGVEAKGASELSVENPSSNFVSQMNRSTTVEVKPEDTHSMGDLAVDDDLDIVDMKVVDNGVDIVDTKMVENDPHTMNREKMEDNELDIVNAEKVDANLDSIAKEVMVDDDLDVVDPEKMERSEPAVFSDDNENEDESEGRVIQSVPGKSNSAEGSNRHKMPDGAPRPVKKSVFDKPRTVQRGGVRIPVTQSVVMDSARFKEPMMGVARKQQIAPKVPQANRPVPAPVLHSPPQQKTRSPGTRSNPHSTPTSPAPEQEERGKKKPAGQRGVVAQFKNLVGLSVKRYSQFESGYSPKDAMQEMGKLLLREGYSPIRKPSELKLKCIVAGTKESRADGGMPTDSGGRSKTSMLISAEFVPSKVPHSNTTVLLRQGKSKKGGNSKGGGRDGVDSVTFNKFFDAIREKFSQLDAHAVLPIDSHGDPK